MAILLRIEVDRNALRDLERELRALERAGGNLRGPFGRTGIYLNREARRNLRSRKRDWGPSTFRLSKSLAMRLEAMAVEVGSNLVYAAIQHSGGTVKPKRKYLALPVPPSLRRRGVWPRDLPADQLKFVPNATIKIGSKRWIGPALVRARDVEIDSQFDGAGTRSKGRRRIGKAGEVLFALVRQVTIKGRPYLIFDRKAREFLYQEIERELNRVLRRSGGR
ncbi:MAG: hypothetical protein H6819_06710 [Phycisphaerales bacterium]|nr:hypothetical protein [Phycisphaerales bacterium]MCB9855272.1 hypothetical protein [Phycisphaerales bacterium]MCB9862865.1 hypothetical protein [Phycisphaerales bacterium]